MTARTNAAHPPSYTAYQAIRGLKKELSRCEKALNAIELRQLDDKVKNQYARVKNQFVCVKGVAAHLLPYLSPDFAAEPRLRSMFDSLRHDLDALEGRINSAARSLQTPSRAESAFPSIIRPSNPSPLAQADADSVLPATSLIFPSGVLRSPAPIRPILSPGKPIAAALEISSRLQVIAEADKGKQTSVDRVPLANTSGLISHQSLPSSDSPPTGENIPPDAAPQASQAPKTVTLDDIFIQKMMVSIRSVREAYLIAFKSNPKMTALELETHLIPMKELGLRADAFMQKPKRNLTLAIFKEYNACMEQTRPVFEHAQEQWKKKQVVFLDDGNTYHVLPIYGIGKKDRESGNIVGQSIEEQRWEDMQPEQSFTAPLPEGQGSKDAPVPLSGAPCKDQG